MKSQKLILIFLILIIPTFASGQIPNLTHPSSQPDSKLSHELYDKMEFYTRETGYLNFYGESWEQDFDHPEFPDGNFDTVIKEFFAAQLGFDPKLFADDGTHYQKDGSDYYLKLSTYAVSYSYQLLKVTPFPSVISFPTENNYPLRDGVKKVPWNELIPNAEGFVMTGAKYVNYDEVVYFYDRKALEHKGHYWNLDFSLVAADENSYRYITAHDYKAKILEKGGIILDDEDNRFVCKLGGSIAEYSSYNGTFSLKIIEEEEFSQSLVLTPDKIKTELDKTGKITLDGIYFDFNKATLKPESRKAILSTVSLQERYTDLVLAVHGHTDNKGSEEYNLKLSGDRAASVVAAIVAEGIDPSRLQSRGFGEAEPIATNETDEGRATNRRVELHKVSGGDTRSVITIDFIKPMDNAVVTERFTYDNSSLGIDYRTPHSPERAYVTYEGTVDVIKYDILKDGQRNDSISRLEIVELLDFKKTGTQNQRLR